MAEDLDRLMTPLQAAIWTFLKERFLGPENAEPRATVLSRYNLIHNSEIGDRDFREAVAELVVHFKKPICTSSAGGYFVARTMKDLEQAVADLESRGGAIFERARALKETIPLERQERLF